MDLGQVLQGCMSPDNQVRHQAEEALEQAKANAEAAVPALLNEACSSSLADVRLMAAVILKKWIPTTWSKLGADTRGRLKDDLLQASVFAEVSTKVMRTNLFACVAFVAETEPQSEQWVIPFLQQCAELPAAQSAQRARGLSLMQEVAERGPESFSRNLPQLQAICMKGLKDPDAGVRQAALQAVDGLHVLAHELQGKAAAQHKKLLQELMPPTLDVLEQAIELTTASPGTDTKDAHSGITMLLEIIEGPQPMLQHCLPRVVQLAVRTTSSQAVDLELRGHACQILNWLASCKPRQFSSATSVPDVVQQLCILAAEQHPSDTHDKDEEAMDDCPPPRLFAPQILDRIAIHLSAKTVLPPVLQFFEANIAHENHACRAAACMVLGTVAEGCSVGLRGKGRIGNIVPLVARCMGDEHARVRAAAASCIAEMACHLQPEMSDECEKVMPALMAAMTSETNPEVLERITMGLDNCIEHLDEDTLAEYLPAVMPVLLRFMAAADPNLHDHLMSCISSAAAAGGEAFEPFAEPVVEVLRPFMTLTSSNTVSARTSATECIGLVAENLGREAAEKLLPTFLHAAADGFALDVPLLREYGHGLFSVSARVLQESFVPFLDGCVQLARKSIELDEMTAAEGAGSDVESNSDGAEELHVHTAVADERAAALQALGHYAEHCGAAFLPYAEDAMAMCKDATESLHSDPYCQALEALSNIVICVHKNFQPGADGGSTAAAGGAALAPPAAAALTQALPLLFEGASNEYERAVAGSAFSAFEKLCEELPQGSMTQAAPTLVDAIVGAMTGALPCQQEEADSSEEGADDEEFADVLEAEEALVISSVEVVATLASNLGPEAFLDAWQVKLQACYNKWLAVEKALPVYDQIRCAFVGVFAMLMESVGVAFAPCAVPLLPALLRECQCEASRNRHHGVYAIGCMMQHCAEATREHVEGLLQAAVLPLLEDPSDPVVDNACGALARCLLGHGDSLPTQDLLKALLQHMPLRRDWEEASPVVQALATFMCPQAGTAVPLPELLEATVRTLAVCAARKQVETPTRQLASACVTRLHVCAPAEVQAIAQSLPVKEQEALHILATEAAAVANDAA